jgi:hypothetical protein
MVRRETVDRDGVLATTTYRVPQVVQPKGEQVTTEGLREQGTPSYREEAGLCLGPRTSAPAPPSVAEAPRRHHGKGSALPNNKWFWDKAAATGPVREEVASGQPVSFLATGLRGARKEGTHTEHRYTPNVVGTECNGRRTLGSGTGTAR